MLECGCRYVQTFESQVLQDGLQEKHCRFSFIVHYQLKNTFLFFKKLLYYPLKPDSSGRGFGWGYGKKVPGSFS